MFLVFDATARPLKFDQPYWESSKDAVPTSEDDVYGPIEVNSYVGNYFHPDGDTIHTEDRWPNLAPPAAVVRRNGPAKAIPGPTSTPDILAPWRRLCYYHCPPGASEDLHHRCDRCPKDVLLQTLVAGPSTTAVKDEIIAVTMTPAVQKRRLARLGSMNEDLNLTSTMTVQSPTLKSTEEAAALYTGAQQWQQYWAHDAAVSPVSSFATIVQSSTVSVTEEPKALSTGAQQWQAYWDHSAANPEVLADEAKLALFAKIFAMPQYLTTAMVTLSRWLANVDPQHKIQDHDTQEHGIAAMISMCDVIGRSFAKETIQEEKTGDLGTAIITTCKTLAQLHPQRKVQEQDLAPLNGTVIAKIIVFFANETLALDADVIRKEVFINMMVSVGKLNRTMIDDAGALTKVRNFNITALRDQVTHRKIENRTEFQNSSPQQARGIEKHAEYANIMPHNYQYQEQANSSRPPLPAPNVSPSASAHRPALRPRLYPLEWVPRTYAWLNDFYTAARDQHPRYPYFDPAEDIYGCTYEPAWDRIQTDKIICPPGGRDGEQSLTARDLKETADTIGFVGTILAAILGPDKHEEDESDEPRPFENAEEPRNL